MRKVKGKNRGVKAFLLFLQLKLALNQATKIMKTLKQPGIIIAKIVEIFPPPFSEPWELI